MIERFSRAGLMWPSLLSLIGLAILLGLGTWQLARKAEKEALIERIEARRAGHPLDLKSALEASSPDELDYQRIRVRGRFSPQEARFYYAPQPLLGPGFDVYQPLIYAPGEAVWVNRGYIPERIRGDAGVWKAPEGEVIVTGNARLPAKPGAFTPQNDVPGNVWYWRDLEGMHRSVFGSEAGIKAAPFFLVAEPEKRLSAVDKARADGGPWPRPGVSEIVIFNRHLEYALTWYGLAVTLVGVFAAYAWSRLRNVR